MTNNFVKLADECDADQPIKPKTKKIVVPKNIISFPIQKQNVANEAIDGQKANIIRKVYIKQSKDLIKKVAADCGEPPKLEEKKSIDSSTKNKISNFMLKVDTALSNLEHQA